MCDRAYPKVDEQYPQLRSVLSSDQRLPGPDGYLDSHGPYCIYDQIDGRLMQQPQMKMWVDEWSPSRLGGTGNTSVGSKSFRDFFVWCYDNLYHRARFVGLYYDNSMYKPDDNH